MEVTWLLQLGHNSDSLYLACCWRPSALGWVCKGVKALAQSIFISVDILSLWEVLYPCRLQQLIVADITIYDTFRSAVALDQ